jgi:hypothetical protein
MDDRFRGPPTKGSDGLGLFLWRIPHLRCSFTPAINSMALTRVARCASWYTEIVYRLLLLSCVTTNVCRDIGVARMRGQTVRFTLTVAMVLLKGSSTSITAVSSQVVVFQL